MDILPLRYGRLRHYLKKESLSSADSDMSTETSPSTNMDSATHSIDGKGRTCIPIPIPHLTLTPPHFVSLFFSSSAP
ncbi:hypothetical protein C0Q70_16641 [Pomacea canaliculata]|uniref:Uncharacterized protein n=1 Tax=Pomacea canaliculata TaxID=400727 RepID=A0A2T7NQF2_POMCA|nr:hypothetical protein C0Q70_16641 [Pomacea canaliculata]